MPFKRPRVCSYPSCPRLTYERFCVAHKSVANREYDRSHRNPKHYDWHWRKVRNLYYSKHPLCESCLERGLHVPADEVHHIRSLDDGGTHDDDNLKSLCKSCHTKTRFE